MCMLDIDIPHLAWDVTLDCTAKPSALQVLPVYDPPSIGF